MVWNTEAALEISMQWGHKGIWNTKIGFWSLTSGIFSIQPFKMLSSIYLEMGLFGIVHLVIKSTLLKTNKQKNPNHNSPFLRKIRYIEDFALLSIYSCRNILKRKTHLLLIMCFGSLKEVWFGYCRLQTPYCSQIYGSWLTVEESTRWNKV